MQGQQAAPTGPRAFLFQVQLPCGWPCKGLSTQLRLSCVNCQHGSGASRPSTTLLIDHLPFDQHQQQLAIPPYLQPAPFPKQPLPSVLRRTKPCKAASFKSFFLGRDYKGQEEARACPRHDAPDLRRSLLMLAEVSACITLLSQVSTVKSQR